LAQSQGGKLWTCRTSLIRPFGPVARHAVAVDPDATGDEPENPELIRIGLPSLQAKFLELEASNRRLRHENLSLHLRLERRKSRRSFEKKICLMVGLWLSLLLLLIALAGRMGMHSS